MKTKLGMDTKMEQKIRKRELELLEKLGRWWGVLTAFKMDLSKNGIEIPPKARDTLKTARIQIISGAFPVCDIVLSLGRAEATLMYCAAPLGNEYTRNWNDSLVRSMKDEPMTMEEIKRVPFLEVIYRDCECESLRCKSRSR